MSSSKEPTDSVSRANNRGTALPRVPSPLPSRIFTHRLASTHHRIQSDYTKVRNGRLGSRLRGRGRRPHGMRHRFTFKPERKQPRGCPLGSRATHRQSSCCRLPQRSLPPRQRSRLRLPEPARAKHVWPPAYSECRQVPRGRQRPQLWGLATRRCC